MSIQVKDANGTTQTIGTLPTLGAANAAGSLPVVLASDGAHAKSTDITSLSTAISGALAPAGGLPVALSAPVSVTQSGSWTIGLASGATVALAGGNTVALKVDGSAVTQPVSGTITVGTLPALPNGSNAIGSVSVSNLPSTQVVTGTVTANLGTLNGAATDASLGTDGTTPPTIAGTGVRGWLRAIYEKVAGTLTVGGSVSVSNLPATQPISATALPLPSGAATAAAQGTGNTSLASIDGKVPTLVSGRTPVDGSSVTQPISAAALPLPAGAATSALQATGNTSLASLVSALAGVLRVGGNTARVPATFTRPANTTAYTSGQLVANSTTAGSVTPIALAVARVNGGTAAIPTLKLGKSSTGVTNASFRVHLYRNIPTASNGDGGAWLTTSSVYLGYADVAMDKVFTDEASGTGVLKDTAGNARTLLTDTAAGSQNIYALIEARAAYTPVSAETFTLTAEVLQD